MLPCSRNLPTMLLTLTFSESPDPRPQGVRTAGIQVDNDPGRQDVLQ
jgi:hypothetical protein